MTSFIESLHRRAEEQRKLYEEAEAAKSRVYSRPVRPLTQQITELMAGLPPAMRERPWSMAELVSRLEGRYRDRPHAQHVGEALRKLGWRRERNWRKGYEGVRLWLPQELR